MRRKSIRSSANNPAAILLIVIALHVLCSGTVRAAQQERVVEAAVRHEVRLRYLLHLPEGYAADTKRQWPFVLYLHGGSARGEDTARLRQMGLPARLEKEPGFPFIVASPLCPEGEIWTDAEAIGALLDRLLRDYRIDPERLYITGHSMGGRGALYMAHRLPGRFAAVAALAPFHPITAWSKTLAQVPLWLVHGAKDQLAPIEGTEELSGATEKAGGTARFTRLEEQDHFILGWYERDDIFDWLLQHRNPR